jgi:hypothetical protein
VSSVLDQVVIPIQFVLFTLSAIIGSAVLYGDFKKATFHQLVTFFYGCAATFLGVFIIAWVPTSEEEEEEEECAATEGAETPSTSAGVPRSATDDRVRFGSFSGRPRTLHPGARDAPSVRRRQSLVGIGVSPAQASHASLDRSSLTMTYRSICSWFIPLLVIYLSDVIAIRTRSVTRSRTSIPSPCDAFGANVSTTRREVFLANETTVSWGG